MKFRLLAVTALLVATVSCSCADNEVLLDVGRPDVADFIDEMVREHDFDRDALAAHQPDVLLDSLEGIDALIDD